jgi:hypothetical protein
MAIQDQHFLHGLMWAMACAYHLVVQALLLQLWPVVVSTQQGCASEACAVCSH